MKNLWKQINQLILPSALITTLVFYAWTQGIDYLILCCTALIIIEIRKGNQ